MRNVKYCVALVAMFAFSLCMDGRSWADEVTAKDTLGALIQEAIENNPRVGAAYSRWKAQRHRVRVVSNLPNPSIKYSQFGSSVETKLGPQQRVYGVAQKIPFPVKLLFRGKAQSKTADLFEKRYRAVVWDVVKEVKEIYYDIFWIDSAIRTTLEEKVVLENWEAVLRRKYESNLATQQDVVRVQIEISRLLDKLILLRQERKGLVARLSSVLNRSEELELDSITKVEVLDFDYGLKELLKLAHEWQPDLQVASLKVEEARYKKRLAEIAYFPDLTFGFDYIQIGPGHTSLPGDGRDAWLVTVSLDIPVWFNRLSAEVKERKSKLLAARKDYEETERNITYRVRDLYYEIVAYKDVLPLYETALLPQSRHVLETTKVGYEAGEASFLDWLIAFRTFLNVKLAHYKAISNYLKLVAQMERLVGKSL